MSDQTSQPTDTSSVPSAAPVEPVQPPGAESPPATPATPPCPAGSCPSLRWPGAGRTLVLAFAWPDNTITWELARWLFQVFDVGNLYTVVIPGGVVAARNMAVRDLVLKAPPHITEVLMVDRDMRPCDATMPFLAAQADIVGVEYPTGNPKAWADPAAAHMGLVRVRRQVFEAVAPPWFMFEYSADGSQRVGCECGFFMRKARQAGFTVARAGWCDHQPGNRSHE
jgi:hypothetical protein